MQPAPCILCHPLATCALALCLACSMAGGLPTAIPALVTTELHPDRCLNGSPPLKAGGGIEGQAHDGRLCIARHKVQGEAAHLQVARQPEQAAASQPINGCMSLHGEHAAKVGISTCSAGPMTRALSVVWLHLDCSALWKTSSQVACHRCKHRLQSLCLATPS